MPEKIHKNSSYHIHRTTENRKDIIFYIQISIQFPTPQEWCISYAAGLSNSAKTQFSHQKPQLWCGSPLLPFRGFELIWGYNTGRGQVIYIPSGSYPIFNSSTGTGIGTRNWPLLPSLFRSHLCYTGTVPLS